MGFLDGLYYGQTSQWDLSEILDGGGQAWPPRGNFGLTNSAVTLSNQVLRLTYFRAARTEPVSTINWLQGNTAAGATPTLVRFGLYLEAANGDLSLVASTANDTALLAGSSGVQGSKALQASYTLLAGGRYAAAWLVVTGATAPTIVGTLQGNDGSGMRSEMARSPRLAAAIGGQSDLPPSIAAAGLGGGSGTNIIYGVLN